MQRGFSLRCGASRYPGLFPFSFCLVSNAPRPSGGRVRSPKTAQTTARLLRPVCFGSLRGDCSGSPRAAAPHLSNPVTSPDPRCKRSERERETKSAKILQIAGGFRGNKRTRVAADRGLPWESGSEQTRCPAAAVWWVLLTLSPRSPLPVPPLSIPFNIRGTEAPAAALARDSSLQRFFFVCRVRSPHS